MNTLETSFRPDRAQRRGRVAVAVVAVLSVAVALYFVPAYLAPGEVESRVGIRENVPFHLPFLVAHAVTAGLALLIGPFQFFGSIRRRFPKAHRVIGRTYLLLGLVGTLTGLVVAVLTTAGPIALVTFLAIDATWLYASGKAFRAVLARDFAMHERWMLRGFAVMFAAVTLRVYLGLFIGAQMPMLEPVYGGDFEALFAVAYTAAIVASYVFNVLFIEIYLRRKANRGISTGAA